MLLLLRLPCRQPLTELFIADDFHNSVHLVMAETAKLGAGKFKFPGLNRREMHVDRQPRHSVLLEAHRRHKETVNHIVRPQNYFTSRFTGTTITPVITSSFEAGSTVSNPSAPAPPNEASSSSGFVAPNFPSGPA